jgi:hypothetical protein
VKKEYIRATHNFDNNTREWTYRGDRGEEKFEQWRDPALHEALTIRPISPKQWSLGVHALKRDMWMSMDWIVNETIGMYKGGADDNPQGFEQFLKDHPTDHRDIIEQHILEEFKLLIELDMVRERERP